MSSSVILQFEEASQEAVLFAEALKTNVSVNNAATQEGNEGAAFAAHIREAWQWLNTPVSLSEVTPENSYGFMKRK